MDGTPVTLKAAVFGAESPTAVLALNVDDGDGDGFVITVPEHGDVGIEFHLGGRFVPRAEIFEIMRERAKHEA